MNEPVILIPTACADAEMLIDCAIGVCRHTSAQPCIVFNPDRRDHATARAAWRTIQEQCPRAMAVILPERIGYIRAVNLGYKLIHDDVHYVGVLNDDVVVQDDFVTPCIEGLNAGAAQVGASIHHVGRDGFWGKGDEPYQFLEGWCWFARVQTLGQAAHGKSWIYDEIFGTGYCEDCDLSIRISRIGGTLQQIDLPLLHLRSRTFGQDREPGWSQNRTTLVERWGLATA